MEGNQGSVHLGIVMRIAIQCSNAAAVFLLLTACAIAQSDKSSAVEIASCEGAARVSSVCWQKLDAGPFSILAPAGWEFHQLQGIDSFVGEFAGDGVVLTFDFGRYSSGYFKKDKAPAYLVTKRHVGGHTATVVSPQTPGHGTTGAYFPRVAGRNSLCIWGKELSTSQRELVLKMFETIRFGGPMPPFFLPPPPPPETVP